MNVRGREPEGIVEPGEEYEAVCRDLANALRELKNPDTGETAVRDVIITAQNMPGSHNDQLPDIIVCWSDEARISSLESSAIGTISGDSPDGRSGTHCPPGFVIAKRSDGVSIDFPDNAHIFDFAPTLLDSFGIVKPGDMDGSAWPTQRSPEHRE